MTLSEHLDEFYNKYNIPIQGGINDRTFEVPLPLFNLKLPNLSWRKKMLYIHDLEHILNQQNVSWKGEMYIASWEISTGFWKSFPIIIFPLWTMGWGLWKHPSAIYQGFSKGHFNNGIANLKLEKDNLLTLDLAQLKELTIRTRENSSGLFLNLKLISWILISQLVFFFPLILLLLIAIIYLINP